LYDDYNNNNNKFKRCLFSAPVLSGECEFVSSTKESITFAWQSAASAASYRLIGHDVNKTSTVNTTTADGLTPGSRYTFTVFAVGNTGLASNNISCINSTGML